jgi:flagellar assembly protein FliH
MLREPQARMERMEYRPYTAVTEDTPESKEARFGSWPPEVAVSGTVPPLVRIKQLEAELSLRDQTQKQLLEDAWRNGLEGGRKEIEILARNANVQLSEQLQRALESFHKERNDYFARVEQEVVRLALAIAERILHREAQLDPLLLTGAVRVALEQLSGSTTVRLKVPDAEAGLWEEMVAMISAPGLRPEVVGDQALSAGDCVFETDLDSVDLGVRSQLAEIERGFFDLLEHRPSSASPRQSAGVECA